MRLLGERIHAGGEFGASPTPFCRSCQRDTRRRPEPQGVCPRVGISHFGVGSLGRGLGGNGALGLGRGIGGGDGLGRGAMLLFLLVGGHYRSGGLFSGGFMSSAITPGAGVCFTSNHCVADCLTMSEG